MNKVIIDMSMSLDGYVAGLGDSPELPLGKNGEVCMPGLTTRRRSVGGTMNRVKHQRR